MIEFILFIFMLPPALLGLFLFVKVIIFPKKAPMDLSNRIAHMRLVWWSINRPELFVNSFEWLKQDELDNLK